MKISLPVIAIIGVVIILTAVVGVIVMLSSGPVISPTSTEVTPQPPVTPTTPITTPTSPVSPVPITSITVPVPTPTFTITPSTPITVPATTEWIMYFENFLGLVNCIKYRYEMLDLDNEEHEVTTFYYYDRGVEVIDGIEYEKVEFVFESSEESSNITLWIPRQAGGTIKAMVNGNVLSAPYAEYVATSTIGMFMNFFVIPASVVVAIGWPSVPEGVGSLTYVSTTQIQYGNTTLTVDKWIFTPNPANPDFANVSKIDIWTSKLGKYHICVYFRMESKHLIHTYELLEIG